MAAAAGRSLQETVDDIVGYRRRTRKLVRALAAITVIAVLGILASGYLYVRLHDSEIGNCQDGNVTKAQQRQLWNDVISLASRGRAPDARGKRIDAGIEHDVNVTYAPANCDGRYPFF